MDEYLKEALELARAQAGVRVMSEDEIASFVRKLAKNLRGIVEGEAVADAAPAPVSDVDPKKSIRERSVICLECGKVFKILTARHLAQHGMTAEEYRARYGFRKGTALVCKALQRERRKRMRNMQLWERRKR